MGVAIDERLYGRLLAATGPRVIETEQEYERLLAEVERLIDRGEGRTREEDALLQLMVALVQDFERRRYPMGEVPPHEMLKYLLEQRKLKQADLLPIFHSRGYISDVCHGKRGISKAQAKALGEFFQISPEVFL
jgi:HTH-type transcriptional regulator/antitoxin HigA